MARGEPVTSRPGWRQVLFLADRRAFAPAAVALAWVLLALWPSLTPLLRYQRDALLAGQWWRGLTAHLVHLDAGHALLNAGGLLLLWTLFGGLLSARQWLATVLCSLLAVDLGLWWLQPQLQWYVGASGVLHGAMAAGCLALLRAGDRAAMPAVLLFTAKLAWERWQGPLPFESPGQVVPAAHLYGAVGGLLAAAPGVRAAILRRRKPEVSHR